MIREDIVFDLLKVAKKRGMIATMSSNGFWGKKQATAWRTVAALKRAGVVRITISYDRYHAKFQGPEPALGNNNSVREKDTGQKVTGPAGAVGAAVVTITDGMENQSREFGRKDVLRLVKDEHEIAQLLFLTPGTVRAVLDEASVQA